MASFKGPMRPWSALEPFGRTVSLTKSGVELFLFDTGPSDGATILLVHGLGDEADTWRHLVPALAGRHRVLAPDLPGFGRSSQASAALSPPFLASLLLETLDLLEEPAVLLVGSSLGGMLCQQISVAQPERASGLVLLDGTMVATSQAVNLTLLLFMIPGVGEWMYTRLRRDPQTAYDTLRPYYAGLEGMSAADQDFLFQRVNERVWSARQRQAYFSALRQLALWSPRQQKGLSEKLSRCHVPTLAIWGASDAILSVEAARRLTQLQPTARLVTIAGAGHLPHQEQPEAVLRAIRQDGRLLPANRHA